LRRVSSGFYVLHECLSDEIYYQFVPVGPLNEHAYNTWAIWSKPRG
jgi:hypothetical protein